MILSQKELERLDILYSICELIKYLRVELVELSYILGKGCSGTV